MLLRILLFLLLFVPFQGVAHAADPVELRLEQGLRAALLERYPWHDEDLIISRLSVPVGTKGAKLSVQLPSRQRHLGQLPFEVTIEKDGQRRTVWASAHVEVLVETLIAARTIGRHQELTLSDLSHARLPLSRMHGAPAAELDEVIGQRSVRRIAQGRPIIASMVEFPPVVHRGDRITLMVKRPGLVVTAMGEARQDGAPNHTIQVLNLGSRRTVQGRVIDANTVEVRF